MPISGTLVLLSSKTILQSIGILFILNNFSNCLLYWLSTDRLIFALHTGIYLHHIIILHHLFNGLNYFSSRNDFRSINYYCFHLTVSLVWTAWYSYRKFSTYVSTTISSTQIIWTVDYLLCSFDCTSINWNKLINSKQVSHLVAGILPLYQLVIYYSCNQYWMIHWIFTDLHSHDITSYRI